MYVVYKNINVQNFPSPGMVLGSGESGMLRTIDGIEHCTFKVKRATILWSPGVYSGMVLCPVNDGSCHPSGCFSLFVSPAAGVRNRSLGDGEYCDYLQSHPRAGGHFGSWHSLDLIVDYAMESCWDKSDAIHVKRLSRSENDRATMDDVTRQLFVQSYRSFQETRPIGEVRAPFLLCESGYSSVLFLVSCSNTYYEEPYTWISCQLLSCLWF